MIVKNSYGGIGSGEFASIYITGISQTDAVSCSKSSYTLTPVWDNSRWEIKNISEYGTYVITASNGTKTATKNVVVDVATVYQVTISYA